jgi:hypothetical protein
MAEILGRKLRVDGEWVDFPSGGGGGEIADGSVTYAKLDLEDGDIPQAKVNSLVTDLAGKAASSHTHTNYLLAFRWNGSAYVASSGAGLYVGPEAPATAADGSFWVVVL